MGNFKFGGLILAAVFAYSTFATAYEVDNFTRRDTPVKDSAEILNREVNRILDRALKEANRESPDHCNRVILRNEVLRWVGPNPISFMELWATFTKDLEQIRVSTGESIYSEASLLEAPAIRMAGIGNTLNISGHHVGTDKLGHFFMQGYDYFRLVDGGKPLDEVLKNDNGEDGVWGLPMTGVKSYADMATNFQGYKFWSSLYLGELPYFKCDHGRRWVRTREFSWSEYVNDAWDEAINCSEMKPTLEEKVTRRLSAIGMRCPVDPGSCTKLRSLEKSEHYIGPKCRGLTAS